MRRNVFATGGVYCPGSGARMPVVRDESASNQWHYKKQPCPKCGKLLVPKRQGTTPKHIGKE